MAEEFRAADIVVVDTEEHLEILADAMQVLSDRRFRKRLHASINPRQIVEVFREAATAAASH